MLPQRKSLRHFQRRPQLVIRSRRRRLRRAQHHVPGERVPLEHVIKRPSSFSAGTCHATSEPWARLVASNVCRTRRIVPASSMDAQARHHHLRRHPALPRRLPPPDPVETPAILSSETARMRALTGSLISIGTFIEFSVVGRAVPRPPRRAPFPARLGRCPSSSIRPLTPPATAKSPFGSAAGFPPPQIWLTHGPRRFPRQFPSRDRPAGSASPARPAGPASPRSR